MSQCVNSMMCKTATNVFKIQIDVIAMTYVVKIGRYRQGQSVVSLRSRLKRSKGSSVS